MLQKVIGEAASDYLYDSGWIEFSHTSGTNTILVNGESFPTNSGKPIVTLVDFRGITTDPQNAYVQPQLRSGTSNVGPTFEGRTNYLKTFYNSATSSNYLTARTSTSGLTRGMEFRLVGATNNSFSHAFPDGSMATHTCFQNEAEDFNFYFILTTSANTGTYAYRYRYMDFEKANEVFQ